MATHSNMLAWRILWMVGHCLSSARYWHPAGAIAMSAKGHSIVLSVSYFTVMGNKVRSEKSMSKSPLHWLWNEFLGQQQHCIEYHDSGQSILLKPTDTSFDKSIMSRRGQSISKERIYSSKNSAAPSMMEAVHCNQPTIPWLADSSSLPPKKQCTIKGSLLVPVLWHTRDSAVTVARSALLSGNLCCSASVSAIKATFFTS